MSFEKKTVAELKKIAKIAGVPIRDLKSKAAILNAFKKEGVTEESYEEILENMYKESSQEKTINIEPVDQTKSKVLMAMRHDRAVLTALGYTFTKDQPYVLVEKSKADKMIKKISNELREATPQEVASFYGA
jgi:hypothetical protein